MQKKCWQSLYQINKLDCNKKEEMLLILSGLEIKFLNKIYKNIQKKRKSYYISSEWNTFWAGTEVIPTL